MASATFLLMFSASPGAPEPHNFQPRFNPFSKQQDVQLGEEAATQVRKGKVVVKDCGLTDYVNRVGKLLGDIEGS